MLLLCLKKSLLCTKFALQITLLFEKYGYEKINSRVIGGNANFK